jgi:hypothetical protein
VVAVSLGQAAPVRAVYAARLAGAVPSPACDAMLAVLGEVVPASVADVPARAA